MRRPTRKTFFSAVLVAGLLAGCASTADADSGTVATTDTAAVSTTASVVASVTAEQALAENTSPETDSAAAAVWDEADVVEISLDGATATSSSDAVTVDGGVVTITAAGTYRLTGVLDDGQVVVDSADTGAVQLILDGADISSSTGAAFVVADAEEAVIVLADGSQNALSDTSVAAESTDAETADAGTDVPNAALYSTADLTITGGGALTVAGNSNDAITSKDGLVIDAGTITVTAVDDGIRGKDYLVVNGGTITVTAGGDGLTSDNADDAALGYVSVTGGTLDVTAAGDGIAAATDVVVSGGDLTVQAGGGTAGIVADDASAKGLKGAVSVVIVGGTVAVEAADDAIHSGGIVSLASGDVTLASGDDGVHADAGLNVAGGTVAVTQSYEGLESANITIDGGDVTLVASDDGVNVAGGADSSGAQEGAAPGGGTDEFSDTGEFLLAITGGTISVDSGGDGLDSNGSAQISGGTIVVSGPTNDGNGALDVNGTLEVSGGVLLAAGSSGMVVAPDEASAQGWVAIGFDSVQAAGTVVHVVAADGTEIASFESAKDFQSIVLSSADLVAGETYTVLTGGTVSGEVVAGLSTSGDSSGATQALTVTAGEAPAGGGGPGGGGGRG
ncbi:carbohydrate-binding domain-containing protein [Pengzhenrongella sicca]|uniref:Carbohydrate-binding domain-containing protein n=1 Tax=Pengzhenrongella sicca TaxID=2819238 RepID=A0A8A4ZBF5_9MICO|nr:carbohydrate-binding domain-containing protein [Pengzhenrongella sicca]QTE29232.1 carbohydrate-binding domain-containing protein [Pengzhenrongella sicca]